MRIRYKTLFIILAAALALSLLPLLVAASCDAPSADDYEYSARAHLKYKETGSLLQTAAAAASQAKDTYYGWQGSFSAVFLFALQPAVFGEQYYCLTACIMLAALLAGIFALCCAVATEIFSLEKSVGGIATAVTAAVCVQLIPSPVQGLFWYNGSVYYTFFFGLSLVALAMGIKEAKRGSRARQIALCALAFIIGGGNYVTALSCAIVAVGSAALLLILKKRSYRRLLAPTAFLLAAFLISVVAPGNAVRQAAIDNTPNAVRAILLSFKFGAQYSAGWFSLPLAGALLFLFAVFFTAAGESAAGFKFPLAVSALSYCLLSAMFCPTAYAMGSTGDLRGLNIIFFAYVLLMALNCFYWAGWLSAKLRRARSARRGASVPATAAAGALCLALCAVFMKGGGAFTSLMAAGVLRSGEAQEYYACAQRRFEVLNDEEIKNAEIEPYPSQPYILYYDDITFSAEHDWNRGMSKFYGKDSVVLKSAE